MWIVLRIALALCGFAIRQLARVKQLRFTGRFEGVSYHQHVRHGRRRRVRGFTLAMPLDSPAWARMHVEGPTDRFFKRIGFATELQTGDALFDDRVYVVCDHPHVADVLREERELRDAIRAAFELGFRTVRFDGTSVAIRRSSREVPTESDLRALARIRAAAKRFEEAMPSRLADRFVWRALAVEGVVWSIAGYAIGAVIEGLFEHADVHVHPGEVAVLGLVVALVGFVLLFAGAFAALRGSSRGHRVIVESAVMLVLSLPIASIQLVSDANRALDGAPPVLVERTVVAAETRTHRGRRGSVSYTYHLRFRPERRGELELPAEIEVSKALRATAAAGDVVEIELGPGRFGLEWYRRIRIDGVEWTAPR